MYKSTRITRNRTYDFRTIRKINSFFLKYWKIGNFQNVRNWGQYKALEAYPDTQENYNFLVEKFKVKKSDIVGSRKLLILF